MSRFSFDIVDTGKAKTIWEESPQGSVFTHPEVLSRLTSYVDWWLASKGSEPLCLWPVCCKRDGSIGLPRPAYYTGPMWSHSGNSIPAHRWLTYSLNVYEGLISRFIEYYGAIHAHLPLGFYDVRAFSWWNYHQPQKPRFTINPKYTALIPSLQSLKENEIRDRFRELRRREIRRMANKRTPEWTSNCSAEEISYLYSHVLARQGLSPSSEAGGFITALNYLICKGWGGTIAYRDPETTALASMTLLLRAKGNTNLVLNLTHSNWLSSGLPAWSIYNSILYARAKGDDVFDFNGANSPVLGDDKHSYGAYANLFFELIYP